MDWDVWEIMDYFFNNLQEKRSTKQSSMKNKNNNNRSYFCYTLKKTNYNPCRIYLLLQENLKQQSNIQKKFHVSSTNTTNER